MLKIFKDKSGYNNDPGFFLFKTQKVKMKSSFLRKGFDLNFPKNWPKDNRMKPESTILKSSYNQYA